MPKSAESPKGTKRIPDLIDRGSRKPTPLGTATFIGLRLLDLPWQYHLLHNGAAERALGAVNLPFLVGGTQATAVTLAAQGFSWLTPLDLPLPRLILLAMAAGSTAKQILWQTRLSLEEFPPGAAAAVSVYNTLVNTANTLLLVCASTSSLASSGPRVLVLGTELPLPVVVGCVLYAAGMGIETLSEVQRARFKRDPRNAGKLCTTGLWGWARHINYFGYALWRGGYCMVASGWVGGLAMGAFQAWDLGSRASGVLEDYCGGKYGEQWVQFKKNVPYRIVPGIW